MPIPETEVQEGVDEPMRQRNCGRGKKCYLINLLRWSESTLLYHFEGVTQGNFNFSSVHPNHLDSLE